MDQRLKDILQYPVMLIVAAADGRGRPALGRSMGARPGQDWTVLDVFIPTVQWPEVVAGLGGGDQLALTLCRPDTYETYQIKGPVEEIAAPDEADRAFAEGYCASTRQRLESLGVDARQMNPWLFTGGLMRVRFRPNAAYAQTPGPGAGRELEARP